MASSPGPWEKTVPPASVRPLSLEEHADRLQKFAQREIGLRIDGLDARSPSQWRRFFRQLALLAAGTFALLLLLFVALDPESIVATGLVLIFGVAPLVVGGIVLARRNFEPIGEIGADVITRLAAFAEVEYAPNCPGFVMGPFLNAKLVGLHGGKAFSHCMRGALDGVSFALSFAELESIMGSSDGDDTIFRGMLFRAIGSGKRAEGVIQLFPATDGVGKLLRWLNEARVGDLADIGDETFNRVFRTYADNPEAALAILTAKLRSALIALAEVLEDDWVIALHRGELLFAARGLGGLPAYTVLQRGALRAWLDGVVRDFARTLLVIDRAVAVVAMLGRAGRRRAS